ncbi:hypothetical protein ACE41H_15540 [Paenibacillus enshidis]|uniref:Uncharacterized protein n=1 Tax=Paenibacillus enshidis TaxID=1458439 RepID=A0ABV5AVX5_9BACL
MDWYLSILLQVRELAWSQGYEGARWPKMVGYDGKQTPSPVAPSLIWQHPHSMVLAELCYLAPTSTSNLIQMQDDRLGARNRSNCLMHQPAAIDAAAVSQLQE